MGAMSSGAASPSYVPALTCRAHEDQGDVPIVLVRGAVAGAARIGGEIHVLLEPRDHVRAAGREVGAPDRVEIGILGERKAPRPRNEEAV